MISIKKFLRNKKNSNSNYYSLLDCFDRKRDNEKMIKTKILNQTEIILGKNYTKSDMEPLLAIVKAEKDSGNKSSTTLGWCYAALFGYMVSEKNLILATLIMISVLGMISLKMFKSEYKEEIIFFVLDCEYKKKNNTVEKDEMSVFNIENIQSVDESTIYSNRVNYRKTKWNHYMNEKIIFLNLELTREYKFNHNIVKYAFDYIKKDVNDNRIELAFWKSATKSNNPIILNNLFLSMLTLLISSTSFCLSTVQFYKTENYLVAGIMSIFYLIIILVGAIYYFKNGRMVRNKFRFQEEILEAINLIEYELKSNDL